jgi:putative membrane protein
MKLTTLQLAAFVAALGIQPLTAQEIKPKPAGDAAPMMTIDKPTFVKMVTSSNEFEIRSSELAKQNADHAGIKMAADMIIADHNKAGDKLKATLEGKGGALVEPVKLAPKHQKMLDQLQGAKGKDFDTLYLDMQAQVHMEAVGLFGTYAGSGEDQSLVGFAKETLPSLETHLGHVKMLIAEN